MNPGNPSEPNRHDSATSQPVSPSPATPAPENPASPDPVAAAMSLVRRLGPAGILAPIGLFLPPLGLIAVTVYINPIAEWFRSHQDLGPALYIALFTLLAGAALMPTHVAAVVGGWSFGIAAGLPSVVAGFVGASLVGYGIGAGFAGGRVSAVVNANTRWRTVRDALLNSGWSRTLLLVALLRLSTSPFALTNFVLAATHVPLWIYTVGSIAGVLPRLGVFYFATQAKELDLSDPSKWVTIIVGAIFLIAALKFISNVATRALERATAQKPTP